ncbi:MAG: hypothetical protein COY39_02740 [Alphaproteobacteria bacterium CG_4_10_14_0_8_um_filter_37_21]|nr:MAG: hypothetical protein COY39_02740 [Alphaproteobacteria bacterium CG_4_10_14_0_8_um_filter_37_21]
MDKLKVLQFKALEDAETIERLQFQLDELNEKSLLAEINAKPPISTATMSTQTDADATPTRDSSTEPSTTAGLAARSTPSPSPAGRTGGGNTAKTSPPLRKNITLLEKKEVGLSSDAWMRLWGTQTLDHSAQVLHCQQGILAIQNWQKGSEPEGSIQAMVKYLNTYAKGALKVPKLTKKTITITTNVDAVCKTQEEAHVTPSESPSPVRPLQPTRGKLGGNFSKKASPSPVRPLQPTRGKLGGNFSKNASPSPVRPGLYADVVPAKPVSSNVTTHP